MIVEYTETPLAVGTKSPRFSWEVPLAGRGRKQSAYQLLVATTEALLEAGQANSTATVRFPVESPAGITEDGTPVHCADGKPVTEIGSGSYCFEFPVTWK